MPARPSVSETDSSVFSRVPFHTSPMSTEINSKGNIVCVFHAQNACRFGKSCRYFHATPVPAKPVKYEMWVAYTSDSVWINDGVIYGGETCYIDDWEGTVIATSKDDATNKLLALYTRDNGCKVLSPQMQRVICKSIHCVGTTKSSLKRNID